MKPSVHAYLALSGGLAVVWLILYAGRAGFRPQMLRVNLATMPLGLTELLFVPASWNPPTLFDLARRTGFDLESLLFSFCPYQLGRWNVPVCVLVRFISSSFVVSERYRCSNSVSSAWTFAGSFWRACRAAGSV